MFAPVSSKTKGRVGVSRSVERVVTGVLEIVVVAVGARLETTGSNCAVAREQTPARAIGSRRRIGRGTETRMA
jgi:hypothetical protein